MEEKRKKADEIFHKRIEEKRKLQIDLMKKEMIERQQALRDEEEKRKHW